MNDLLIARLASSGLLTGFDNPLAAIKNTVGIQSQEQKHAAEVSTALRTRHFEPEQLTALYSNQRVVQAWANRWTLHLFAYEDWELLINARQEENLPDSYFGGRKDAAKRLLADLMAEITRSGSLTKREILDVIQSELSDYDPKSYFHYAIMHRLVHAGTAFIDAASPVNNRRFIAAKNFKRSPTAEAIEKLVPRYLQGFGPASLEDFCKWAGLRKTSVRPIWDKLQPEPNKINDSLKEQVLGHTLLGSRFDSLMTGYVDKTWLVPADKIPTMWTKNGFLLAPILFNGQLVGHWNYRVARKQIAFQATLWQPHDKNQLEKAFSQLAEKLDLSVGDVTYL